MDARAQVPAAPKAGGYLPIQDKPPERDEPTMTADERLKIRNELIAARDRQAKTAKAQKAPAPADPAKP